MELVPETSDLKRYLEASDYVDFYQERIMQLADSLASNESDDAKKAAVVFYHIQRNILHTFDTDRNEVSIKASDVIRNGHGICYAKANLAAALLRYMEIPAGFCYQKFRMDEAPDSKFVLHCVNAVYLKDAGGWFRMDVRNVVEGIDPAFKPGRDSGVIPVDAALEEADYAEIYVRPRPVTIKALMSCNDVNTLSKKLPEGL